MKKLFVKLFALAFVTMGIVSVALATGPTGSGGLPRP